MSDKPIKVKINIKDYPDNWSMTQPMIECWIVSKLKEKGIPIIGTLRFNGVKSGTLIRFDDPSNLGLSVTYTWKP